MANPLGEHFIIELYDCKNDILDDQREIKKSMLEAADLAGATVVGNHFHKFSPQGVSGVVVIAESHLSIHTWPEHNYAAVDFFTCSTAMKMEPVFDLLRNVFAPADMEVRKIPRGILDPDARSGGRVAKSAGAAFSSSRASK